MSKHHHHNQSTSKARLLFTMTLNFIITIVELIGGIFSGSLSLISDALHNFSDGIAIIVSYIAIQLGNRGKTESYTFGWKRAEIIAAIINSATLVVICFFLFKESYHRLVAPEPIQGGLMILVASIGLVANVIGTLLLRKGSKENINIRSAYLHLLSDAVSSVAVIMGGVAIYFWEIYWLDPILTIAISLYILKESIDIIKEAVYILMMGAPKGISLDDIKAEVEKIPEIQDIHHIHIWKFSDDTIFFEAHINLAKDTSISESTKVRLLVENKLKQNYGITHTTLQLEYNACK